MEGLILKLPLVTDVRSNTIFGIYEVQSIDKAKKLLSSIFSGCFNAEISIKENQIWAILTDSFTEEIISFCQIVKRESEWCIDHVCTDSKQRKKGFGKTLITNVLNKIKTVDPSPNITLDVLAINDIYNIALLEEQYYNIKVRDEEEMKEPLYSSGRYEDEYKNENDVPARTIKKDIEKMIRNEEDIDKSNLRSKKTIKAILEDKYAIKFKERKDEVNGYIGEIYVTLQDEVESQTEIIFHEGITDLKDVEKELKKTLNIKDIKPFIETIEDKLEQLNSSRKRIRREEESNETEDENEEEESKDNETEDEESNDEESNDEESNDEESNDEESREEPREESREESREEILQDNKRIYYNKLVGVEGLREIISFYSDFFKVKGVRIDGKKLFIVMVNIKGDVRLESTEIKKKNLELVDYFMATYNPLHIELNEKGYFYFANINTYNPREVINNIFKHSPNPSIVSFLLDNCRNISLSIPEEHVDSILIKYNFYFLWYFQQPETRTYFLTVNNTNSIALVNPLLQGEILWAISAYTPTYYDRLSDFISESYSSVLPLALNEFYFNNMLTKFKGMGYIESENYTDICNSNKKVKFRSIIFTNKIEELPLFEDELYLKNSRNLYMAELSGEEKYVISRGELKMLQSLLRKDVEYGGLYGKAKIDSVNVEGKELTRYNLYTSSAPIRGEEKGVPVPTSDVNYHSHPNYCTSNHKLIVAWPSGLDMKIISSEGSLFTTHIKTHLCITSNGIFFIKLTPKFYNFIQTLTMSCKNILFNLIELYFKGIEDLRNIEEISKKFGLEQAYKENIEKQLDNPEQCIQINIDFFTAIINEYLLNINKVTLKDIFDYTRYKSITTSRKSKIEIQERLRDLIYDITTDFFCEESIKKGGVQDYPLYIIKFSNWDALLQNTYYEFD